jgi:hypothetical protein
MVKLTPEQFAHDISLVKAPHSEEGLDRLWQL